MTEEKKPKMILQPLMLAPSKALVLRVCHADGTSSRGFKWPLEVGAEVVAPDWDPEPVCGGGLHGWLWGVGCVQDAGATWGFTEEGAKWMLVEVDASAVIAGSGELKLKCKYPRGVIRFIGSAKDCAALLAPLAPAGSVIIAGTATAGDYGTATAGDYGTATAGYDGTATAGDAGTATAGVRGTATAGDAGTATAGYAGTATAGYAGTATAGDYGTILLRRWDEKLQRYRWVHGEVGIDGVEANVPYKLDESGKLVKVQK